MNKKTLVLIFSFIVSFNTISVADTNCNLLFKSAKKLRGTLDIVTRNKVIEVVAIFKHLLQFTMEMETKLQQEVKNDGSYNFYTRESVTQDLLYQTTFYYETIADLLKWTARNKKRTKRINDLLLHLNNMAKEISALEHKPLAEQKQRVDHLVDVLGKIEYLL